MASAFQKMTDAELDAALADLERQADELRALNLKLDMARGKPSPEQTALSKPMLDLVTSETDLHDCATSVDNYGDPDGLPSARALAAEPEVLLADEPVSMLDVTIRKEILDLMDDLRRTENLAVLYITHDLGSARTYSDDTLVMYHGEVVERGASAEVIGNPKHEYTQRLLAAAPNPKRRREERERTEAAR